MELPPDLTPEDVLAAAAQLKESGDDAAAHRLLDAIERPEITNDSGRQPPGG